MSFPVCCLDVVKSKTIPGEAGLHFVFGFFTLQPDVCCFCSPVTLKAPGVTAPSLVFLLALIGSWPGGAAHVDPTLLSRRVDFWCQCSRSLRQQEGMRSWPWWKSAPMEVSVSIMGCWNCLRDMRRILPYSNTSQMYHNPAFSLWYLRATCTDVYILLYCLCIFILHFL